MKVLITLKGLKTGEDHYIESTHEIEADDHDDLQGKITAFIYEYRNINQYYKVKYTNIQEIT
jgi:hypothetical protein